MIKLLLVILLVSSISYAQPVREKFYASLGFGFSSISSGDLNNVIDQYNASPLVVKDLPAIGTLFGPNLVVGVNYEKDKGYFNLEFGFAYLFSGTKKSEYSPENGVLQVIDVQMQVPTVSLSGNYFMKLSSLFNLGAGVNLNLGSMNVLTRNYTRLTNNPQYTVLNPSGFLSYAAVLPTLSFNFKFTKQLTLSFRPYYYLSIIPQDFSSLNNQINPFQPISSVSSSYFSGPGVSLNFLVKIGK